MCLEGRIQGTGRFTQESFTGHKSSQDLNPELGSNGSLKLLHS